VAVEAKRGCGYRKVGGYYLVGGGLGAPCDRLPYPLDRCHTCGGGVKFTRGHTWLQPTFFLPIHDPSLCRDSRPCPVCGPTTIGSVEFGPHLLLWIGRGHYTPASYLEESNRLGVSRRLSAVPKGLVLGETWVLLAHIDAVPPGAPKTCTQCGMGAAMHPDHADYAFKGKDGASLTVNGATTLPCGSFQAPKPSPGIFCAFVPRAIELILRASDATPERVEKERKRGVTVVAVPDDDPDHHGSVWDKDDDSQPEVSP
jgi:hypothetical protein